MHLSDQVTIIIPTLNRHKFLSRILEYYEDTDIRIVVADSTEIHFKNIEQYSNLTYHHYSNIDFITKITSILSVVSTPYTVICADDDFIIPSGLEKCINFLENNHDYVCASGRVLLFNKKSDVSYSWGELSTQAVSIDQEKPDLRFYNHFSRYLIPTFYCPTRTETLKYIWQKTPSFVVNSDARFSELLLTLITVIRGKFKLLDCFYSARQNLTTSTGRTAPTILSYFMDGSFDQRFTMFKKCLVQELQSVTDLTKFESLNLVDKGMESYLGSGIYWNILKGKIKMFSKMGGLYQIYRLIIERISNETNNSILPTNPYENLDHQDYNEWKKIMNVILKHNI